MLLDFGKKQPCASCEAQEYCGGCPNETCICCKGFCVQTCTECHVVCCRSTLKKDFIRDIRHSFELDTFEQPDLLIPSFMPVIDGGLNLTLFQNELPYVVIRAKSFITPKGNILKKTVRDLHSFYGLPSTTKIVAVLSAREFHLEEIWSKRKKLITELRHVNLYAIISSNLTLALNDPRYWNIVNMKRNNIFANDLLDAGFRVIPDISWCRREDLLRVIDLLNSSKIMAMSLTLQLMRNTSTFLFKQLLSDLLFMKEKVHNFPKLIFYGAGNLKAMEIIRAFPNVSFIESRPFFLARAGRQYTFSDGRLKVYKPYSKKSGKEKMFLRNIDEYRKSVYFRRDINKSLNRDFEREQTIEGMTR